MNKITVPFISMCSAWVNIVEYNIVGKTLFQSEVELKKMMFVKSKKKKVKVWHRFNHILKIVHTSENYILIGILRNVWLIGNGRTWYIAVWKHVDGREVEGYRKFSSDILKASGHDGPSQISEEFWYDYRICFFLSWTSKEKARWMSNRILVQY